MSPFERLALLACASVIVGAWVAAGVLFGWLVAGLVVAGAIVLGVLMTVELGPAPTRKADVDEALRAIDRPGDFVLRRRDRREIEDSARRAADEQ